MLRHSSTQRTPGSSAIGVSPSIRAQCTCIFDGRFTTYNNKSRETCAHTFVWLRVDACTHVYRSSDLEAVKTEEPTFFVHEKERQKLRETTENNVRQSVRRKKGGGFERRRVWQVLQEYLYASEMNMFDEPTRDQTGMKEK